MLAFLAAIPLLALLLSVAGYLLASHAERAEATPLEQAGTERYVSDLNPTLFGATRKDTDANGGTLVIGRTDANGTVISGTGVTYAKGIGMFAENTSPGLQVARPSGCQRLRATIGHDNNSSGTNFGFRVNAESAGGPEIFDRLVSRVNQTPFELDIDVSARTILVVGGRGSGMGDWGSLRFTGCPATATATPTRTATATPTRTATAVPPTATAAPPTATAAPPTGTAVPPTATQAPPTATPPPAERTLDLGPGETGRITCATGLEAADVADGATAATLRCKPAAVGAPTPAPATPTATTGPPTATPPPAPSGARYGGWEDANSLSTQEFAAYLPDAKADGFSRWVFGNGGVGKTNEILSVADQHGVEIVIGPLGEIYAYYQNANQPATIEGARAAVGPAIDAVKGHPSHRAYFIADEPPTSYDAKIQLVAQVIRERDPGRGVTGAFLGTDRLEGIGNAIAMDPWMVHAYPASEFYPPCTLNMQGFGRPDLTLDQYLTQVTDQKQGTAEIWMIPQAHQFRPNNGFNLRYPTEEEMRAQDRIMRARGAATLIWFHFSDILNPTLGEGLRDNPPLYGEATEIAKGTATGPSCEGGAQTPGPTATTAPATPTPTPAPPTATPPPPSGGGIPAFALDYAESVEQFWGRHWANPASPTYRGTIGRIGTTQDVAPGQLQAVVDSLPQNANRTLRLLPGNHGRVQVFGKSNLVVEGADRATSKLEGAVVMNCPLAYDYTALDAGVEANDPAAVACARDRNSNVTFRGLTFDGRGAVLKWDGRLHLNPNAAFVVRAMKGVVLEDASIVNYGSDPSESGFAMPLAANYRCDDVWWRRVDIGVGHIPSLMDGCHGGGVVDSIVRNAPGSGLLWFVNDDATNDRYPFDGVFEPHEVRDSRYIVVKGNSFLAGNFRAIELQARNAIVEDNRMEGAWGGDPALLHPSFLFLHGRVSSTYKEVLTYHQVDYRVRNNWVQGVRDFVRWNGEIAFCSAPGNHPCSRVGDYRISGNRAVDGVQNWLRFENIRADYPREAPTELAGNVVGP